MLAIILSRRDFREADQIVSLYSQEHGKLELLATGIKKITSKHAGNLLPGALVDISLAAGRDINHLTKVQPIHLFKKSRDNWQKGLLVNYVLALVDKVAAVGIKDECLFNLLKDWLQFVDEVHMVNNSLVYSFIAWLFNCLGLAAEVHKCVRCHTNDKLAAFSLDAGGVICASCLATDDKSGVREAVKLNQEQLIDLQTMFYKDWAIVNQLKIGQIVFDLIHDFAQYHSERKLSKFNMVNYVNIN